MAERAMRPRKGDIYIVLNDGDASVRILKQREFITPDMRAAFQKIMGETVKLMLDELSPALSDLSENPNG